MANDSLDEQAPAPDMTAFGKQIADGIAAGMAAIAPPKKVTAGEYARRNRRKVNLTRPAMQNGAPISPAVLSDEEIILLNKITRSGRYLGRKVEVIVRQDDTETDSMVEIRYSNRTPEQRIDLATKFRDLKDLLKQIVLEQEIALENETVAR